MLVIDWIQHSSVRKQAGEASDIKSHSHDVILNVNLNLNSSVTVENMPEEIL